MIRLNSSRWCKHLMQRHWDGLHALGWNEKWCRYYTLPPVEWGRYALGPQALRAPNNYWSSEVSECACGRDYGVHAKWSGWSDGAIVHGRTACEPGPFVMGPVYGKR